MLRTTSSTGVVAASPVTMPEAAVPTEKTATASSTAITACGRLAGRRRARKRPKVTATMNALKA